MLNYYEIELSPDKQYLYIVIPVDEGPQYRFGKVDVKGDLVAPKQLYFDRMTIHTAASAARPTRRPARRSGSGARTSRRVGGSSGRTCGLVGPPARSRRRLS